MRTGLVEICHGIDLSPEILLNSVKSLTSDIMTYEKSTVKGHPEIICFKKSGNLDLMELDWHQDGFYFKLNTSGALLYNFNAGETVRPTLFVDTCKVIESLDEDFKELLRNSSATWNFKVHFDEISEEQKHLCYSPGFIRLVERGHIKNSSKILVKHPVSGKDILMISPGTLSESDLTKDQMDRLRGLFDKYSQPLVWKEKQLILYDNLRYLHRRDALDPKLHEARELRAIRFNYEDALKSSLASQLS
jgi:alpha-ketoglutarate-dependent taurine dioxygenase